MRQLNFLLFLLLAALFQSVTAALAANTTPAFHAVTTVSPGQAGYIHYFVITHPDNTLEDHVGIELEDQRIAWSFPGAGVMVSEFIKSGELQINHTTYRIEHLHGLRPFKSERDMQTLRADLTRRVAFWIDDETPYCVFRQPGMPFCLNCGDFVTRILFPSPDPLMVAFPEELARSGARLSTPDDLLLYMLGLYNLPDASSQMARLAAMNLPESLRHDVQQMLLELETAVAATPAATEKKPMPRLATRRPQNRRL